MNQLNVAIRDIQIPSRMTRLPISNKGYPVPWFVAKINGEWDFRVIKPDAIMEAIGGRLCWLCGQRLGVHVVFTIGPMCTVNRISAEPPSHLDCAQYAVRACPFLNNPRMRRNDKDMPEDGKAPAGIMIERNPGVTALWVCKTWKLMRVDNGVLFCIGDPERVEWFCESRTATRSEVETSISSGLSLLEAAAEKDGPEAIKELRRYLVDAMARIPQEA